MDVIDERAWFTWQCCLSAARWPSLRARLRAAATFGLITASVEGAYWMGRTLLHRSGS
jgi:hypothetical protein